MQEPEQKKRTEEHREAQKGVSATTAKEAPHSVTHGFVYGWLTFFRLLELEGESTDAIVGEVQPLFP